MHAPIFIVTETTAGIELSATQERRLQSAKCLKIKAAIFFSGKATAALTLEFTVPFSMNLSEVPDSSTSPRHHLLKSEHSYIQNAS